MNLYVCWTKQAFTVKPGGHPCGNAYRALRGAGHDPKVVRSHSIGFIPAALQTPTRKLVKEKTGKYWVPALETDEGEWISGSEEIIAWAAQHPALAQASA
jgi:hypothetical protein